MMAPLLLVPLVVASLIVPSTPVAPFPGLRLRSRVPSLFFVVGSVSFTVVMVVFWRVRLVRIVWALRPAAIIPVAASRRNILFMMIYLTLLLIFGLLGFVVFGFVEPLG